MSRAAAARAFDVRPIRPDDRELIRDAVAYTSPETYYQRFHAYKRSFSDPELTYLTEVDGDEHVALIAVDRERPDMLVGIARFVRVAPGSAEAELAITVHDPYQGRGVGTHLMRLLVDAARSRGVSRLRAIVQADNRAMIRLMHGVLPQTVLDRRDGSVAEYVASIGSP